MSTQHPTAAAFARLAVELHDSTGVAETVETAVQFARQALSCRYAGLVLLEHGRQLVIAAVTAPIIADLYQLQIDAGTGPLIASLENRAPVTVADATTDDRWSPQWSALTASIGVRSVLHLPLMPANQPVGVLSLFAEQPNSFEPDDLAIAHILARHASIAVANARNEETLSQAVDARKLVGQAMGILMERFDLDGDRAFEVLRRYSQDSNTKLRDVAQQLIDTRKLPGSREVS
ncbi:GAF and ANTAR domain-containing protein [Kribbella sp. CA-293567]|uniref:GAF and ANTAR domain-containing protein n=1 Tax=Kribbella sp. CA-293567 TaxID=3002436 RepID=UPI0022DD1322|nr:GAF and ANTAR domain-containing protein [Kribbella sp. CA-293567]WBQ04320.1 GAF and ANTAR domain-containing protein [Kribbella sp. CA-293567]